MRRHLAGVRRRFRFDHLPSHPEAVCIGAALAGAATDVASALILDWSAPLASRIA
jgi:hypothetical protein